LCNKELKSVTLVTFLLLGLLRFEFETLKLEPNLKLDRRSDRKKGDTER
jgi:hypothetical protein